MLRKFYIDSGYLGALALVLRLKDLVAIPIMTSYAGVELYGAWTQSGLIVAFAGPLIGLGLRQGFVRHAAGLPEREQASYLLSLLLVSMPMAAVFIFVVGILPGAIDGLLFKGSDSYRELALIASLLLLVNTTRGSFDSWWMIQGRAGSVALLRTTSMGVWLCLFLALTSFDVGFVSLILGLAIGEGTIALALCVWFVSRFGFVRPNFGWFKAGLRYGLPLLPSQLSVLGVHSMDRLFIVQHGGLADVGTYAVTYAVSQVAVILATTPCRSVYENSAYASFNQERYDDVRQMCQHTVTSTLAIGLPAVVALFMLSDVILAVLTPPEFSGAGHLMGLIGAAYLAQAIARIYRVNIGFSGTGSVFGILLATFVTNLVLNALLIPEYGLIGAAVATFVAFAVAAASSAWLAHRVFPCRLDPRLLRWIMWATLAMVITATAMLQLFETAPVDPLVKGIVVGIAALAAYGGVLFKGSGLTIARLRWAVADRDVTGDDHDPQ
jgi:O-antigen/teichoic acid export membrane protein